MPPVHNDTHLVEVVQGFEEVGEHATPEVVRGFVEAGEHTTCT